MNTILLGAIVAAALVAVGMFIQSRRLGSARDVLAENDRLKANSTKAEERLAVMQDITVLFGFSIKPDIPEESYQLAQKRLVSLGSGAIMREWEALRKPEAREEGIYSLRVQNLFLALISESRKPLQQTQ